MGLNAIRVVNGLSLDAAGRARIEAVSPQLQIEHRTLTGGDLQDFHDGTCEVLLAAGLPGDPMRAPALLWVQLASAGVDHLPELQRWPTSITLTNGKGVFAAAMGQYVLGALLQIAEGARARDRLQQSGSWPPDEDVFVGRPLRAQTLVIVGYGATGREVARLAAAVGMRVLAVTAAPRRGGYAGFALPGTGDPDGSIPERIVAPDQLAMVAAEADAVALTAPLTAASRGIVSAVVLGAMRRTAWIINVGRGALVDEAALLDALRASRIGGAVLDVFEQEPLPSDHPYWQLPNVVLTPHVSGGVGGDALVELLVANLRRYVNAGPLLNVVDPSRGY